VHASVFYSGEIACLRLAVRRRQQMDNLILLLSIPVFGYLLYALFTRRSDQDEAIHRLESIKKIEGGDIRQESFVERDEYPLQQDIAPYLQGSPAKQLKRLEAEIGHLSLGEKSFCLTCDDDRKYLTNDTDALSSGCLPELAMLFMPWKWILAILAFFVVVETLQDQRPKYYCLGCNPDLERKWNHLQKLRRAKTIKSILLMFGFIGGLIFLAKIS